MTREIKVVDLFCGCGGLSLGFDSFKGDRTYRTILGIDIDAAAVRCYNSNHSHAGEWTTGRLCDITWFGSADEVLLYYLVHYAYATPDRALQGDLSALGLNIFLGQLRRLDESFQIKTRTLFESPDYVQSAGSIDKEAFKTGICRAFLDRLGLGSVYKADSLLSGIGLPWGQEYSLLETPPTGRVHSIDEVLRREKKIANSLWNSEIGKLREAAQKTASGQQSPVPKRAKSVVAFLGSEQGKALRALWIEWRAERAATRIAFLAAKSKAIVALYTDDRRVHLILGGPPCKGFSRIGRPVMSRLREQGSYSWSSEEFGDERNALLYRYVLFLEALKPNVFIFENVRNFESVLKTPNGTMDAPALLEEAIAQLSGARLNYHVVSKVITASDFGIPQNRLRYIMAGFNSATTPKGTAEKFFSIPTHSKRVSLGVALAGLDAPLQFVPGGAQCRTGDKVAAYTLVDGRMDEAEKQYIEWVRQPQVGSIDSPALVDAHIARRLRADDKALLEKFAPGQRWMDYKLRRSPTYLELESVISQVHAFVKKQKGKIKGLPTAEQLGDLSSRINGSLLLRLMIEECKLPAELEGKNHLLDQAYLGRGHNVHGDWFERLDASRPCKTIVAHIGKDTYGYSHPFEARGLSMREAARVQSFPDWFSFGSVGVVEGYSMIGNAVPPLLAHKFAERLNSLDVSDGLFAFERGVSRAIKRSLRKPQVELLLNKI